ncbi:ribonuclease P protein subunit p30 isoform X2 [Phyllobates terribilis]|uniref:ribonuclease P protein subunit p30 isoform X2 n=1 Tax=Phyllobates terribilis TaxID=111132 RepID=UPI003CCB0E86
MATALQTITEPVTAADGTGRMAVFVDLNITNCMEVKKMQSIIEMAAHLGYSAVAINHVAEFEKKKVGKSTPINILSRLTIKASDPSHYNVLRSTSPVTRLYDIVAVYPTTEKLFHAACTNIDVDMICINVTEKSPFFFKRPSINSAIERGIFFELIYSPAIKDSTIRRYTISNAINLMEICKGKNVILSSGAEKPLDLRGPYDVATLGLLFGLPERSSKAALSTNCRAALLHGETRKTAFGVTYTVKKPQAKEDEGEASEPAFKKAKKE